MNMHLLHLIAEPPVVYAYIDPGTGSMLFTILIGAVSVIIYNLRGFFIKLRYSFSTDAVKNENTIPIAIFSDDKRYWNTFGPICDELEKSGQRAVYMSQSEDDPAFNRDYKNIETVFIGKGNTGYAKLNMLDADIVLSTTPSLDVYQWKRSKNVKYYIHILHAVDDITSYRMFGVDYYDAIIVSGDYHIDQIRKLEKMRNLPNKEVVVLGIPYLDQMKKRLEKTKKTKKERTVLLAPSWGETSMLNKYGTKMLDALIATGYHIIVRPHPQSFTSEKQVIEDLMKKYPETDKFEWNRDNDNFDVLSRADILISDFSGIVFDFALIFNRPVIYADFSFDKSVYDAWWLDEEMWKFTALKRIGVQLKNEDIDNIKDLIDQTIDSKKLKEGIKQVKQECWANEGKSVELISNYLINKRNEILEKKNI